MLGRTFDQAFRHFTTLALIAAVVVVPLHVVYTVVFRDVITVAELHPVIEALPEGEKVAGVDAGRIHTARLVQIAILLLELALVPLMARAARRALSVEDSGGVATVRDAYLGPGRTGRRIAPLPALAAAAVFAFAVAWLLETSLVTITRWVPTDVKALLFGAAQVVARTLAAPVLLSALAAPAGHSGMPANRSSSGSSTGTRDSTNV